jgi:hypothetical protein
VCFSISESLASEFIELCQLWLRVREIADCKPQNVDWIEAIVDLDRPSSRLKLSTRVTRTSSLSAFPESGVDRPGYEDV